ncbi:uncharacterized protein LOC130111926 [Lampris incognitus]|uniref:uncharacterized protein LOC130111926 n=1 Tax=Lampris incognitus TaxID=2546036 RepID=UPI0024B593C0|nr:uncharacterized protein LOC130111926 [Lampris incognitus]
MVVLSTKPKQRTAGNGVRSTLYKAVRGELPDPDVLKVAEAYKDFPADIAPLITNMSISAEVPLVSSKFGDVQEGSPVSYQHPVPVSRVILIHPDARPPPPLPLDNSNNLDMARKIEAATREQSACVEWHRVRRDRVTSSHFREVCHVRGARSAEHLAERMIKGVVQTPLMKRGLALDPAAIQDYCRVKNTNYWPCGFIIHPDAPWLGSSPDGVVFDPTENPPFGLLEIKCPNVKSYVGCKYLKVEGDTMTLKKQHSYFWQTKGQLLVSGM